MYQKLLDPMSGVIATHCVCRVSDGAIIPADPMNTDYQAYLTWKREGGVPLDPEQPTVVEEPAAE